jgi:heat shock protein HslJ
MLLNHAFGRASTVVVLLVALTAACGADDRAEITAAGSSAVADSTTTTVATAPSSSSLNPPTTSPPSSPAPEPSTTTTEADWGLALMGQQYTAEAAYDGDEPHSFDLDRRPFVRFQRSDDGDIVAWSGGCNQFGTALVVQADRLVLEKSEHGFIGTAMGCEPPAEAQDIWVTRLMGSDPAWQLDPGGSRLTLTGPGQRLVLTRA